jgi:hypothetical protein
MWVVFVVLVLPFREARSRNKDCQSMLQVMLDDRGRASFEEVYKNPILVSMREARTLPSVYRDYLPYWPWVLAVMVIPPVLVYGMVAGAVRVVGWIVNGFKS